LFQLVLLIVEPVIELLAIITAKSLFLDHHVLLVGEDFRVRFNDVDKRHKVECKVKVKCGSDAILGIQDRVND